MSAPRQQWLVVLLYSAIAIALLSPMSSASVLPDIPDTIANVAHTIQARMALEEGQFPIRVAPWQHNGWRYPVFQFYGQFIYTMTGLLYKFITPSNPFMACLIVLWLALTISAFFTYLTSFQLTRCQPAAILAGVSYMAAPYFLVNIHARGAFAEAVAQGVVPVVLYCVIRCYLTPGRRYVILGGIAWFVLATTHTITFVYTSLFLALFILLLGITKRKNWRRIIGIGISYSLGWLLALYFLAPVVWSNHYLGIGDALINPHRTNWVTLFPALLQPVSLPPEIQFSKIAPPHIHPTVGWVMLIAWATVIYFYLSRKSWPAKLQQTHYFVAPLLGLFALAFFMTWSPFDFWQFLPRTLWVTQFTYRILTQVMWTGALLCGYALVLLFRSRLYGSHLVVGLLLITMASTSYLPRLQNSSVTIRDLVKQPDLGYGHSAYLYKTVSPSSLTYPGGWLLLNEQREFPPVPGSSAVLHIAGEVPSGLFNKPITLTVIINGKQINQIGLKAGKFIWDTPLESSITNNAFLIKFITDATIVPKEIEFKIWGKIHVAVKVNEVSIQNTQELPVVTLSETRESFQQKGAKKIAQLLIDNEEKTIQISVLFYPNLIQVKVDGKSAAYSTVLYNDYALVSLRLAPGSHTISVIFTGLSWANWVSAIAWLVVAAFAGLLAIEKTKKLIISKRVS